MKVSFHLSDRERLPAVLSEWVGSAHEEVLIMHAYVESFFLLPVLEELTQRGVRVRILLDKASRACGGQFRRRGLSVKEFKGDARTTRLHHKVIIIDRQQVLVGSVNLFERSMYRDLENLWVIDSRSAAERFCGEFDRLWQGELADPVDTSEAKTGGSRAGPLGWMSAVSVRRAMIAAMILGIVACNLISLILVVDRWFGG